jgi:hypothetical protein
MKRFVLIIFVLFIFSANALQITEVESNPAGDDSGNEWMEIYSLNEINLGEYTFVNNDNGTIVINESVEGYFVYTFPKQWLDNHDEKISIYKGSELIFETPTFDDSKNDENTYSYCVDSWKFQPETPGEENCENESVKQNNSVITPAEEETNLTPENLDENVGGDIQKENESKKKLGENITIIVPETTTEVQNMVTLNPKTIKTKKNNEKVQTDYTKYSIIGFGILLLVLYKIKPKKKKNEFREKNYGTYDY